MARSRDIFREIASQKDVNEDALPLSEMLDNESKEERKARNLRAQDVDAMFASIRSEAKPAAKYEERKLGKYHLGFWAPGSRVQLTEWIIKPGVRFPRHPEQSTQASRVSVPGDWVRVVSNYAKGTGVVVVENERVGGRQEKDAFSELFEVDPTTTKKA